MVYPNETLPEETGNYTDATEDIGFTKSTNSTATPILIATTTNNGTPVIYLVGAIAVGAMGLLANAAVFTLLCFKRKSERNVCNALIHNQTAIDFSASVFLIITYVVKIYGVHLTGTVGQFYCKLFGSEAMFACGMHGSTAGLMIISIERYTKIVHSLTYLARYRPWMKYVGLVFPWIYSVVISFPFPMATSDISNGRCLSFNYWSADWLRTAYGLGTIIWKVFLPLAIFFFCYTKILLLIKEQSKFHASSSVNNGQNNLLSRSEKFIVKIMLVVVVFFVVSYAPAYSYFLAAVFHMNCCVLDSNNYYIVVWIFYLNVVINPFIYSANSEIVRSVIRKIGKRLHRREVTGARETVMSVIPNSIDT